jgi:hypothetical protein
MFSIASTPHDPLSNLSARVDAEIVELVEACLVKDREHRLESAQAVFDRLERIALRLSQRSPATGYVAGRRATDRLRPLMPASRGWFGTAPLPLRVMPLGVRVSSWAQGARGTLGVLAGAAIGCGLTYVAKDYLHSPSLDGIKATPAVAKPAECVPKTLVSDPVGGLAHNSVSASDHRAIAAARETDLVRAVARGLSRAEPATQTGRPAPEHNR